MRSAPKKTRRVSAKQALELRLRLYERTIGILRRAHVEQLDTPPSDDKRRLIEPLLALYPIELSLRVYGRELTHAERRAEAERLGVPVASLWDPETYEAEGDDE